MTPRLQRGPDRGRISTGTRRVPSTVDVEHTALLIEWLRELRGAKPDDREIAFMLDVAARDPLVVDDDEEARLHQLSTTLPQGTRAIILRDAAVRLLARTRWR